MLEIHAIRREDLLTAFSLSAVLRLRRRFQALAELYRQQRGNTRCGAANRRSEKNAFSEAASIFPLRLPLRGLKGASSPFLATATTAASGGNREELLGQRPAGCERQRSRRWEPQPVGSSASKSLVVFWFSFDIKREQLALMKKRSTPRTGARRWCFSGSLLTSKENISLNANALCPPCHRRASLPHGAAYLAYSPIFSKPSRV